MFFTTESGSTYEVNKKEKKIRRLNGITDITARVGKDGEWKPYKDIGSSNVDYKNLCVGHRAIIVWNDDIAPLYEDYPDVTKTTITTKLVSIFEKE